MPAVQLNFKKIGKGRPMIILHGLFGNLDNWKSIANELQNEFTLYLVDLRNHGKSPHTSAMNYQLMSKDIQLLIEKEGLYRTNIIGHSMGGKVCFQLLQDIPDEIHKAMIIDITSRKHSSGLDNVFKGMFAIDIDSLVKRSDAETILSQYIPEPSTRQFILKSLERLPDNKFVWKINLKVLFDEYDKIGEEIKFTHKCDVPLTILSGSLSPYVQKEDIQFLNKEIFTELHWKVIQNAGHWVHAEKPLETIQEIREFFNE
ncbi:MAG: alpha/beta fold hydrolase [Saprospiraceae bacterium]|nr:alpha/beta fold hydrolase [Saprospiraceae bacterium]